MYMYSNCYPSGFLISSCTLQGSVSIFGDCTVRGPYAKMASFGHSLYILVCCLFGMVVSLRSFPNRALSDQELSEKSMRKPRLGGWAYGDECSIDPAPLSSPCSGSNLQCSGASAATSWSGRCFCVPGFVVDAKYEHCIIDSLIPLNQTVCNTNQDCAAYNNTVCLPSTVAGNQNIIKRCQCTAGWDVEANSTVAGCTAKLDCRVKARDFCSRRNPQFVCSTTTGFCACPARTRINAAGSACEDLSRTDCTNGQLQITCPASPTGAVANSGKCDTLLRRCTCSLVVTTATAASPVIPVNSTGMVYWTPTTPSAADTTSECRVSGLGSGCYNNAHCALAGPYNHICFKGNASNPELRGVCACPPFFRPLKDGLACTAAQTLCCGSNRDCGTPASIVGGNTASGISLTCQTGRCLCPSGTRYEAGPPPACVPSISALVCDPTGTV